MAGDRSRYGLLVAAIGAVVLAVSVFLPWYGVSLTAGGVALAQQVGEQAISQFGNATLQGYAAPLHANLGSLAGQQLASVSAHQALKQINIVLLILAGLALLDTLFPLVRSPSLPVGAGGSLPLVGAVAITLVLFRIVFPPIPEGGYIALSIREGAWLALLGSAAVIAGGLWPRLARASSEPAQGKLDSALSSLSGWTPEG